MPLTAFHIRMMFGSHLVSIYALVKQVWIMSPQWLLGILPDFQLLVQDSTSSPKVIHHMSQSDADVSDTQVSQMALTASV